MRKATAREGSSKLHHGMTVWAHLSCKKVPCMKRLCKQLVRGVWSGTGLVGSRDCRGV